MSLLPLVVLNLLVQAPVAGTYDVLACTAPCTSADSALVVARGIVVLTPAKGGCYDLVPRPDLNSYLALWKHAPTNWNRIGKSDTVTFHTYRSPDAGHVVRAVVSDSGFVGWGHSGGAGAAYINAPDEFIVGRRVGPPDLKRCSINRDRRSDALTPLLIVIGALGFALVTTSH